MFLAISNTTECPVRAPEISTPHDSRGKAIDSIIRTMHGNFELNADGSSDYCIHLPYRDDRIETEAVVRKALENANSVIVDHMDYDVRYNIVEV